MLRSRGDVDQSPPSPRPDDTLLVQRLRQRDAMALRAVYQRFSARIFRFLVRLCDGRRDVAEDLHQETWIAAARFAPRLQPSTDLAAWLFTVARNKARSWRRWSILDLGRRNTHGDLAQAPAGIAEAVETRHDLTRALQALPPIHREVLLLVGCEGLATEQVGLILGIGKDAVRQRVSRARAALAEALGSPVDAPVSGLRKEEIG